MLDEGDPGRRAIIPDVAMTSTPPDLLLTVAILSLAAEKRSDAKDYACKLPCKSN